MEGVDSSFAMNDAAQPTRRKLKKLPIFLIILAALLILLLVPPFISIGHYKNRITGLISASLGRPVRLSSVEMRLLPWPGFVMTDLTVAEDPAYGAEPVLHADTVRANIRLLSLWRGRLEISSINVDDASLNLVHAGPGKWNLDPLFRTAAAKAGAQQQRTPLPYLEATNSRINIKDGAEKLPFSLINTDLSFWQENPGEWRIRLRGQPARTDVVLNMGDTGIVRLEASIRSAPALHLMPVHADLDWRAAQLGQLSRLMFGSDPGWRGDLTGEAHLDGTPEAAHITARLRATGVHRAEFTPPAPLDFDANCGFVYHYSQRALDDLACNSPLGDGRLRLTGDIPGGSAPSLTLELDQVPAAAGLDALRTVRSGFASDLEAGGTVSGKLTYAPLANDSPQTKPKPHTRPAAKQPRPNNGPLTGSITVEG
jgi:AsmA family